MTANDSGSTPAAAVLLIGDPRLRRVAAPASPAEPGLIDDAARLHATLAQFRAEHGFGRAVAATQIGVARRFIALNLGEEPLTMFNPEIVWRSGETFTLWDDCMSFPFLLVRVAREVSISVEFEDEAGCRQRWDRLDRATSELLQHEIDHLDGVLALDRAVDRDAIVAREVFESMPERFAGLVDFP
jgi:peptide deformylase